jgi:two-component system, LytTR family, response regulator
MIKTIIIDDEYNAREFLEKLLSRYFANKFIVVDKCESVDQAVLAIEKHNPDLVFLDVQMPNKNGFELFKEIKNIDFEVIFTTAHSEFAIDAIRCSALDYLLKPINYIDLMSTIKNYDAKQNKSSQINKLQLLLENIDSGNSEFNKIALPTETGFELIKPNSIIYCGADSNYCKLYLSDGKIITVAKTLKYIEELLPKAIFSRIHKTYLVNLNYVIRFNKTNELLVELSNGQKLPVSIRKKEEFIHAIIQKK